MVVVKIVFVIFTIITRHKVSGGISAQWDECGCRWDEWESWGTCSSECNGNQNRSRAVWLYDNMPGCVFAFTTCATRDLGWDTQRCNTFCYNERTSDGYFCTCVDGFYGSCCGFQITCGNPGFLTNGEVHGMTYTYGSNISYSCNANYLLVDGSSSRTCTINSTWNGTKPRCAYFNSCGSGPCKNAATCTNLPDDYACTCTYGWSGKDCDIDILPPEVTNCSSDKHITTDQSTVMVDWQEPQFSDLHDFDVTVTSNYPTNSYTFPWDDFTVSYSALKPSNGLQSECIFDLKIRPNSCRSLDVPENGAVVCNNWKKDFGQICILFCKETYTVARGVDPNDFYICGASGSWVPSSKMPDCSVHILESSDLSGYQKANTLQNCTTKNEDIQNYYVNTLQQSEFKYFCEKYKSECMKENVEIRC